MSTTTPTATPTRERDRADDQTRRMTARASRAALRLVLDTPCPAHGLPAGVPCWVVPGDARDRLALCGARIRRAGYSGSAATSHRKRREVPD